jgi:hypothetical protein
MNQFIFKSRWIAIAFAVLTLFSTYVVVSGFGGGAEADSTEGAQPAVAQADPAAAEQQPPATFDDSEDEPEFVDDEELIDDAGGNDPSPDDGEVTSADSDDSNDFAESDGAVHAVNNGRPRYAPDGVPIVMTN